MTPPPAKSRRANETSRPLRPAKAGAKAGVTAALMTLEVFPALPRPENAKSFSVTWSGFLQE
ncbi:hypothetical protein N665_0050s0068 [Sinapis alba]|nr:hypothetical protein N665_0050s0068 [Sinapis alba]